jgi:hypothetical protein
MIYVYQLEYLIAMTTLLIKAYKHATMTIKYQNKPNNIKNFSSSMIFTEAYKIIA